MKCVHHQKIKKNCMVCQTIKGLEEYRKKTTTPRSKIKQSLRQLWLRSRERASALKRDNYTCTKCHRKQSKAKGKEFAVCVHHLNLIDWDDLINLVHTRLLQDSSKLVTLCKACHDKEHSKKEEK
jgi:5-methylcytosine-specific restriction endonuclease McrA